MTPGEFPAIIKASGEKESYDEHKLRVSLERAGASPRVVADILDHVRADLREGVTTERIYRHAQNLLARAEGLPAVRYSLRRAVMGLGPTGHPFELLISELFRSRGYTVSTGVVLPGVCVSHEIDVYAVQAGEHVLVEAKYHNALGIKSDVKVALYTHARFVDIVRRHGQGGESKGDVTHVPWIITNTKFTSEAVAYGECVGLRLVGWNYPKTGNLQDLIEAARLHPVTALFTLPSTKKRDLLIRGVIFTRDLVSRPDTLREIGLSQTARRRVLEEAAALL